MPRIAAFDLFATELPFRVKFKHAAKSRDTSSSFFLKCTLDDGTVGWGEALPRPYVTGETRDGACDLLRETLLPRLIGREFTSFAELYTVLDTCDGIAPPEWLEPSTPQSAAWCAVDLALLDSFGKCFQTGPFPQESGTIPSDFRYSGVLTSGTGLKRTLQLYAYRILGFRAIKLKVDTTTSADDLRSVQRRAGRIQLRADANMAWSVDEALHHMPLEASFGVSSFEQPLAADDLQGAARLIKETGLEVMADESLNTRASLQRLIELQACTAINARVSKCGGLVATLKRCREAIEAGLWVQVGCQVGESSLLSAAHLHLCHAFGKMRHAEGCFGKLLLEEDPAEPLLQMKGGGRPPALPKAHGLGVIINEDRLATHVTAHWPVPKNA
jgi:L-alanine-DL-glutamate epimerase-like enolase superfamily enzyme